MARRVLPITSLKRLGSLSAGRRETYARTLHAHRLMRAGMSKTQAAREAETTPRTMDRYLGDAIVKRDRRWHARPGGRLHRCVWLPTTSGMQRLAVSGRDAELRAHLPRCAVALAPLRG